jgi:hypothetical protein
MDSMSETNETDGIPFTIEGTITYDNNANKIIRNITTINVHGKSYNNEGFATAKIEMAKEIAKLKAKLGKSGGKKSGGHGYAKNSTEYKKQKEILKTKTLRFKSTSNNKTHKK